MLIYMITICANCRCNPSAKCRDIASHEKYVLSDIEQSAGRHTRNHNASRRLLIVGGGGIYVDATSTGN